MRNEELNEWNAYNGLDTKLWADGAVKPEMAGHGHAQQSRDFINELKNEKTNLTLKAGIYKLTSL
jgi:hypothetical protein